MYKRQQSNFTLPEDNTIVVLTLPDPLFLLAQCIGLEVVECFGIVARFNVVDICFESKGTLDEVHDLVETPLEGS